MKHRKLDHFQYKGSNDQSNTDNILHPNSSKVWQLSHAITYNYPYLQHIQRSQSSKAHQQEVHSFQVVAVHIPCISEHPTAKYYKNKQLPINKQKKIKTHTNEAHYYFQNLHFAFCCNVIKAQSFFSLANVGILTLVLESGFVEIGIMWKY